MAKTISTHNGSAAHRDHNIRNKKATRSQSHIDPDREQQNEILHDEPPREAYRRIFGAAIERYNAKQSREDRKIKDYYTQIQKDAKKHPVYEMIVQIGDRNDTGIDAPVERECLKEFYAGWAARNPNLECIGAYIHADETAGTLHMHLDYVPVAHGYRRGMDTQTGLVKALGEMGFEKDQHETAQIQWQRRENDTLEQICISHGIQIQHPMRQARQDGKEKARHYETAAYIEYQKALERCEQDIAVLQEQKELETNQLAEARQRRSEAQDAATALQSELSDLEMRLDAVRPSGAAQPATARRTMTGSVKLSQQDFQALSDEASAARMAVAEADGLRQQVRELSAELAQRPSDGKLLLENQDFQALSDEASAARMAVAEADGLRQQVRELSAELAQRPSDGKLLLENLQLHKTVDRLTQRLSMFVEWATDRLTEIWRHLVEPIHAKHPDIWSFRQAYHRCAMSDQPEDKKWVAAYTDRLTEIWRHLVEPIHAKHPDIWSFRQAYHRCAMSDQPEDKKWVAAYTDTKLEIRRLEGVIGSEEAALDAVLQRVTDVPPDRRDQIVKDSTRKSMAEVIADARESAMERQSSPSWSVPKQSRGQGQIR